jgi:small GTP-binding protein
MNEPTVDFIIAVAGDSGVGKSCVTFQFVKNTFIDYHDPTVEDSYIKKVTHKDKTWTLEILDTAGQEEFKVLRDIFVRKADVFILIYDVTNSDSIKFLDQIVEKIEQTKEGQKYTTVLMGNKCDLERGKKGVTAEQGNDLAKKYKAIGYFEASAKTRTNIDEAFLAGLTDIIEKKGAKHKPKPKTCIVV